MVPRIEERPEIIISLSFFFFFLEGVDSMGDGEILWGRLECRGILGVWVEFVKACRIRNER